MVGFSASGCAKPTHTGMVKCYNITCQQTTYLLVAPIRLGTNYAWDQCWDLLVGCKGLKFGGGDDPRLLRGRPLGEAAIGDGNICGDIGARVVGGAVVGVGDNARRGTRVSLSDWLAFQARIRGSKDPRLLRDRPTDGAAIGCGN